MALTWQDATHPAGAESAGTLDDYIRALKTAMNADLAWPFDDTLVAPALDCRAGWPRIFTVANAAARVALAPNAARTGVLCHQQDTNAVYLWTGAAWVNISSAGPVDMRIPLKWGPGLRETNAVYAVLPSTLRFLAGVYAGAMNWTGGGGVSFNKANVPDGATVKFAVIGNAEVAAQAKLKLVDTVSGDVAGSEVTLHTDVEEQISADIVAAITAGARVFNVHGMAGAAAWYDVATVELRIQRT